MMNQMQSQAVYRLCAVTDERWDVLTDPAFEPVASFSDKHAALAYAMSLARTRPAWQLPPTPCQDVLGAIDSLPRRTRDTRI